MIRYITAGESHGQSLTAIIEGIPAGLPITEDYINVQLARRQTGYGRGGRMKIEKDRAEIVTGVRNGLTIGSPITLIIHNKDWSNWEKTMSPHPGADIKDRVVTKPRPGHADLSGAIKYRQDDIRNILERASARETAIRVAACTVGRRLIEELGAEIYGHVTSIGQVKVEKGSSLEEIKAKAPISELFCADASAEERMKALIDEAKVKGDSLGGIFEIIVKGLPVGLGSHVQWDRKLDGRLAKAVMSIQAIKGVEIGLGFEAATRPGSEVHDEIFFEKDKGFFHVTNKAGGLEGGITNGEPLLVRAAMKPIPTLYKPLQSVDIHSKETFQASVERSDVCAVPAATVVGEAVVAMELASAMVEKFGGDSLAEMKANLEQYLNYLRQV